MLKPTSITTERGAVVCGGVDVQITSLTGWLDLTGVDYREWDETDFTGPFRWVQS